MNGVLGPRIGEPHSSGAGQTALRGIRPPFVTALGIFFFAGAAISLAAGVLLLSRGGPMESLWSLNPRARLAFARMGPWAIVLMVGVSAACTLSGVGLWRGARWGRGLAAAMLALNLLGGAGKALLDSDLRAAIGIPIAGTLLLYLWSDRVGRFFAKPQDGLPTRAD